MYFTYVWTNAIGKYSCLVWLGFMVGERWPINLSFLLFSSLFHVLCCIGPSIACCLQLWLMLVNGHGRPVGDPRPERVRVWASKWTRGGHGFFSGSDSSVAGTGLGGQNPMGPCPLPTLAVDLWLPSMLSGFHAIPVWIPNVVGLLRQSMGWFDR